MGRFEDLGEADIPSLSGRGRLLVTPKERVPLQFGPLLNAMTYPILQFLLLETSPRRHLREALSTILTYPSSAADKLSPDPMSGEGGFLEVQFSTFPPFLYRMCTQSHAFQNNCRIRARCGDRLKYDFCPVEVLVDSAPLGKRTQANPGYRVHDVRFAKVVVQRLYTPGSTTVDRKIYPGSVYPPIPTWRNARSYVYLFFPRFSFWLSHYLTCTGSPYTRNAGPELVKFVSGVQGKTITV
ncbi:hypothetical protein EDC04DRAFT_3098014 [Pisolithus marmoratus]|nr:hypothetical protein EDC04DRAFT_3098014 [Pisolithus marmoratus]